MRLPMRLAMPDRMVRNPPTALSARAKAALVLLSLLASSACVAKSAAPDSTATSLPGMVDPDSSPTETVPGAPIFEPLSDVFVETVELTGGLDDPVVLTARSGTENLYVAERSGIVRVFERQVKVDSRTGIKSITSERLSSRAVLDLTSEVDASGEEQGLLGMTFSSNGARLYVAYTDEDKALVVDEYPMQPLEERASTTGSRQLLRIEQLALNHNGGHLVFGADGFLYVGVGDGGGEDDPFGSAQDTDSLLGSILRIDPDVLRVGEDPPPYEIPSGNPFIDGGGRPEIWLYGVQDPWRFSFDAATGDMWIADTGGNRREEVTRLKAANGAGRGANLGWAIAEGTTKLGDSDLPADSRLPIHEYEHGPGCRLVGGFVYRGTSISGLSGAYLFGDRCTGVVSALLPGEETGSKVRDLGVRFDPDTLVAFGVDDDGVPYVLTSSGGLHRILEDSDARDEWEAQHPEAVAQDDDEAGTGEEPDGDTSSSDGEDSEYIEEDFVEETG